jgi:SH3-like domain-containing protein
MLRTVLSFLLLLATIPTLRAQPATPPPATPTTHKPAPHTVVPPHRPLRHKPPAKPTASKPAPAPTPPPVAAAPATPPAAPPEPPKGTVTGLPLPRFAALRSDQVNLRSGPGMRYPIDWVYQRRDLPVEIEREFEVWRLVALPDGEKGWVHEATLTGRRSFIVTGTEQLLYGSPDAKSAPVAKLMPGVIGSILKCEATSTFCQVQTGEYRGYLPRDAFWGTLPTETIP